MSGATDLREALALLKSDNFRPRSGWEKAHQICQSNEGDQLSDWIHALIHRIEGDDANAGYWYRRACKARHLGTIEEEWALINASVEEI